MAHLPLEELARQAGVRVERTSPGRARIFARGGTFATEAGDDFIAENLQRFLAEGIIEGRIDPRIAAALTDVAPQPVPFRSIIEPAPVPDSVKKFQDTTECLDCVTRSVKEQKFITLPEREERIAGPVFRVTSTALRPQTLLLLLLAILAGGFILSR